MALTTLLQASYNASSKAEVRDIGNDDGLNLNRAD